MLKKISKIIITIVFILLITTIKVEAGNNTFFQKGVITDNIEDITTKINYSLYVPTDEVNCKDIVFVFHGYGASKEDYNGIPLYYSLKQGLYMPNAYVVFIKKDKGSWSDNIEKEDLSIFINSLVAFTGTSRVHLLGYSQGVYDANFLSSCYTKWTNCLLIDGSSNVSSLSKKFKNIIWVAGYDKNSYLSLEVQQYVSEYYEPMAPDIFTSEYPFHYKSAVFAMTSDKVSQYFGSEIGEYYDCSCLNGIEKLIKY